MPQILSPRVFTSDSLACDCSLKTLLEWKEKLSSARNVALEGICSSPKYPLGRSIGSLSSTDISCGKCISMRVGHDDMSWNVSVLKFRLIFADKPFNPLYFPLYLSYSFSFWNLLLSHNVLHSMTLFVLDACFVECELIHP